MSTIQQSTPEVALIMADLPIVKGWQIHWLLSKKQIEYILTDITALPPSAENPRLQRAQYQEAVLPVFSLEQHFGFKAQTSSPGRLSYIVTKSPAPDGRLVKAILRVNHPVRVRKLNFNSNPAQRPMVGKNSAHVLGAFTLPENLLVIIPDLAAIIARAVQGEAREPASARDICD